MKGLTIVFLLFFGNASILSAQTISKSLVDNQWSAYDHFVVMDFQEGGKVILEYAYCTYCLQNRDTLDWRLTDKLLQIGQDSLQITKVSKNEISTEQHGHEFKLVKLDKVKPSKLDKSTIEQFLLAEQPMSLQKIGRQVEKNVSVPIQFSTNGKMWLDKPEYRGQWALKSFYGQLFLIYIHRHSVNRNYPLIKIKQLKNGKLSGQPIPSIRDGLPFELEIH